MAMLHLPISNTWQNTLAGWKRVLENHLNSGTANTNVAANKVTVTDNAGYFAGSNTESVLAELGSRWVLSTTGLPTASSSYTRKLIYLSNGAGVADKVYVCYKKADNSYDFAAIV